MNDHSLPRRYRKVVVTKKYMVKINGIWKRQARSIAFKYRRYCPDCGEIFYTRYWF